MDVRPLPQVFFAAFVVLVFVAWTACRAVRLVIVTAHSILAGLARVISIYLIERQTIRKYGGRLRPDKPPKDSHTNQLTP